ncbi:MAG: hypothetical protein QOE11_2461 [Solirubrobacteraceae bacterium]|nr:hypothetical protein [Solirubrobacteraceae bacterium]
MIGRDAQNLRVACGGGGAGREQGAAQERAVRSDYRAVIEPTAATGAANATGGTTAAKATATAAKGATSFATQLASASSASSAKTPAAKATARPDGEQTKPVAGHPYARIENGADKGLYLNQAAGNPRVGSVFRLVSHAGHIFHVYGTGKDKVVIAMTPKSSAGTTAPAPATTTPATTT